MLVTVLPAGAATSQSAATTVNSAVVNVSQIGTYLGNIGLQVTTVGIDASDATVNIQHSNDGVNFVSVDNSTLTLASGSATQCQILTNMAFAYYRVAYVKGSNTTGTYSIIVNFN